MGLLNYLGLASAKEANALRAEVNMLLRQRVQRSESGVPFQGSPQGGRFTHESNTEWRPNRMWATTEKMEHDPHVIGGLRANWMPLLNASWDVIPATDKPKDVDIAEFCAANLLRKNSDKYGRDLWVKTSWLQRLSEILRMHVEGFSMFGLSMRQVGAKLVYDQIHWLEPSSVDPIGWVIEKDELIRVKRTYANTSMQYRTLVPLEASEIALYPWDFRGARFDGTPLIRSMYGAWMRKTYVQQQSAIWAQKAGAPAPMGIYPEWYGPDDRQRFDDWVQSQRGESPAESYISVPMKDGGVEPMLKFVGAENDLERGMTALVQAENSEIAHAAATKSDMLGETNTGSRAVGETQQSRELSLIQSTAAVICQMENHGVANLPGMIERLVEINFAGAKEHPQLVCTKIDPQATLRMLPLTVQGVAAGIIPNTPELRRQVTEGLGYRLADEAYEIEPITAQPPNGKPPADDEQQSEDTSYASLAAFEDRVSRLLQPSKEGAPVQGGRFPHRTGGDGLRFSRGARGLQGRSA